MKLSKQDRFWSKVEIIPFHSCWEWTASKSKAGYGRFSLGRKLGVAKAHRISWSLSYGTIPEDLCVLHRCDNPGCVRPEHLFLGTIKDNVQDMISKNRGKGHFSRGELDKRSNGGKHNSEKEFCPKGHPYAGANLAIYNDRRNCRECVRQRSRRDRANKRSRNIFNKAL